LLVVEDTGLWYKARAFGNSRAKLDKTLRLCGFFNDTHMLQRVYGCLHFTREQVVGVGHVEA
jgi:hypothetical protein